MDWLKAAKTIYFIGIGGVSMSGLAALLSKQGYCVSGSDSQMSEAVTKLQNLGITVYIGHFKENITPSIDLAVYTAAIAQDNPELEELKLLGIKTVTRAELLGRIAKDYKYSIAVSGTHGKTTTTAMLAALLLRFDPTVLIGGEFGNTNENYRIGGSDILVFEACEYADSFLEFYPAAAIILNIEYDHPDYFKTKSELFASFKAFAQNVTDFIIINEALTKNSDFLHEIPSTCKIVTIGTSENAAFQLTNLDFNAKGHASFDIKTSDGNTVRVSSAFTGSHNAENAVAAFALCKTLYPKLDPLEAANALSGFVPPRRRFEIKGKFNGAMVADDYAHHPTEIRRALAGAELMGYKRIFCLFQPHTYSRTTAYFDDFAAAFSAVYEVGLLDIYAAREKDDNTVSSLKLSQAIQSNGVRAKYFSSFAEAKAFYQNTLTDNDLFITMGAGDVYKIGDSLLQDNRRDINEN